MRELALFWGLMVLMGSTSWAAPEAHSTRYEFDGWGATAGLPQISVNGIAQDDRGFLWVATFGGLARFDGHRFVRVDPPRGDLDGHRFVAVACEGARIWAGTDGGRLFYFDSYGREAPREFELGLGVERAVIAQLIPTARGLVLGAGPAGVFRIEGARVARLSRAADAAVAVSPNGGVWVGGLGTLGCVDGPCGQQVRAVEPGLRVGRLLATDDGPVVGTREGLKVVGPDDRVTEALPVAQGAGHSWVVTPAGIRAETRGRAELLPELRVGISRRSPEIRLLFVDSRGTLWLGTNDQGLLAVRDRGVWAVDEQRGLAGRSVLVASPQRDGSALISSYCNGLQRLTRSDEGDFQVEQVAGLDARACVFLATDVGDGLVVVGSNAVLYRYENGRVDALLPLPSDLLSAKRAPDGHLWVGGFEGLFEVALTPSPRVVKAYSRAEGLSSSVYALAWDRDGSLVLGTRDGAMRLRDGVLTRLLTPADDRRTAVRDLLLDPDGVLWLATYGEGLARVEPSAGRAHWFNRTEAFCSDEISRIIGVGEALWFNSNQGTFRVPRASFDRVLAGQGASVGCELFDSAEGNGGAQLAGGLLSSGELIFPTVAGVAVVDPQAHRATVPQPTFIEAANVDDQPLTSTGPNRLPPGSHTLVVELASPYSRGERYDLALRSGTTVYRRVGSRVSTWMNLAPGPYEFTASRLESDGSHGPPVALTFELEPAFLQTRWAQIGGPSLALLLLGLFVRGSVRSARSRADMLQAKLDSQVRVEAARRERDAMTRAVFEGSPTPLFLFSQAGALLEANPAARRLLGERGDEVLQGLVREAASGQPVADRELRVPRPDGARTLRVEAALLQREGQPTVLVATTDLTALREAEAQREGLLTRTATLQRLEGLGRLAAGIAHDFNNVLAMLSLQVGDLAREGSNPQLASEMANAVELGRGLTQRFLIFGKADGATPGPLLLDEALTSSGPLLARLFGPQVDFVVQGDAAGCWVRLDRSHLDQLLLNLVINARDAIGDQPGRVSVRTARGGQKTEGIQVLPRPAGAIVELIVEDSGRGMSADVLTRAFEPFFTTKPPSQGTGVGLTVVHSIASHAGAGLLVRSEPGRGTCFVLQFAVVAGSAEVRALPTPTERRAAVQSTSGVRPVVLVCDDLPLLRSAVGRLFHREGFQVLEASDGAQALEVIGGHQVSLVVTDLRMAGMNGAELIARLRSAGNEVPVILLSGYTEDVLASVEPSLRRKVVVVAKPFVPDHLLTQANDLLQG